MSGFYIGVDGVARKTKGGYIGVDGVARKMKKGYIGDENGVARLCWIDNPYDPVFANNTWEQIADACSTRRVPETWSVGDQKTMTIDGIDYLIDVIGKDHDDYADGSGKAPLTFQIHELYSESLMHSGVTNVGGWEVSQMRTNYIPTILAAMPLIVQNKIKEVNKLTSKGGYKAEIITTADKLFLLSEIEVYGEIAWSKAGEGSMYEFYSETERRTKYLNGKQEKWWLRSPYGNANHGYCIAIDHDSNSTSSSQNNFGVSFAFCF